MRSRFGVAILVLGVSGCLGAPPEQSPSDNEQWFTLTVVKGFNSDGSPIVDKMPISLSDEIALREQRHAAAQPKPAAPTEQGATGIAQRGATGIAQPGETGAVPLYHTPSGSYYPCDSGKLWIFDNSHETGNSMCFWTSWVSGDGCNAIADLAQYCVDGDYGGCSASWWGRVRSYWVPTDTITGQGYFQTADWSSNGTEWYRCTVCNDWHWNYGCGECNNYGWRWWGDCSTTHEAGSNAQNARYIIMDPYNACGSGSGSWPWGNFYGNCPNNYCTDCSETWGSPPGSNHCNSSC